jgi:SAM-dependent methyltransferase
MQSPEFQQRCQLLLGILNDYDAGRVDTTISPADTMPGDNYLEVGESAARCIISAVATSRITSVRRVLDLPCGHGRVLRHLAHLFPRAQIDACDLDTEGVKFCADTFGAHPIQSQEDLTKVAFPDSYDLIWIGSLFTHTSFAITKAWLTFLSRHLSENGIIVATFHGRWATRLHKLVPYPMDDDQWAAIMSGYDTAGYGYHDYRKEQSHDFIEGSYGLSVARAHTIVEMIESIPNVRLFMYQERGWGDNHDVVAFGKPDWDDSWWPV